MRAKVGCRMRSGNGEGESWMPGVEREGGEVRARVGCRFRGEAYGSCDKDRQLPKNLRVQTGRRRSEKSLGDCTLAEGGLRRC